MIKKKNELAHVFATVLRPFIDELKREFVGAVVEVLDQQANDFANIMQAQSKEAMSEMMIKRDQVQRERERDENKISELMLEGLRKK